MENNNDWGPEGPPFDPKKLVDRPQCTWREDENGQWEADKPCGYAFEFTEGSPQYNNWAYCPKCGKPLVEVPYEDEEVEE
jgi:hypothetical protein